jgi:hypothetical protein
LIINSKSSFIDPRTALLPQCATHKITAYSWNERGMNGLKTTYQRFVKHDPEGYDHPSLTKAFNDLAKSPVGRDILKYYRDDLKGPLMVYDGLPPGVYGETSYSDIIVRSGVSADTLAHEMRHAYQFHDMCIQDTPIFNPFFSHMMVRMIEADAFSFGCLNAITRWNEIGYKTYFDVLQNETDIHSEHEAVHLRAFHAASLKNFDPDVMPRLMRKVFDIYYRKIATTNSESSYEQRAMESSVRLYQYMDKRINPSRESKILRTGISGLLGTSTLCSIGFGYPELAFLGVSALVAKGVMETMEENTTLRMIDDFGKTKELIDGLAEKLGVIPGMKENYLTNKGDLKLSDPVYTHLMDQNHHKLHQEWQDKIQDGIKKRGPSINGPR